VNGGVRDIGGQAFYLNRSRRWYWGPFGLHLPQAVGQVAQGIDVRNGTPVFVEQLIITRQTESQGGIMTAYPFSRANRIEFNAALRRIGFSREVQERTFEVAVFPDGIAIGQQLTEDRFDLDAPPAINLVDTTAAFVRDTSVFGATSPLRGQRVRAEINPWFNDLRINNVTLDFRHYFMPVPPVTLAFRGLHFGRYGRSAEDERLTPLYVGYSTMVRGYNLDANDCTPTLDGSCPEFDRLLGSRLVVGSFEARAPLVGLFRGRLEYGPVPVEIFGFADTGMAWTRADKPDFAGGTRKFVTSVGVGTRVNVFGFIIAEFNMARPLNRDRGWVFVFNLRPGW
jgi:hypothetical protein